MINAIGFIPLRAGSKGIPFKNRRKMLGRPLFSWVLLEALLSDLEQVVVFSDDDWILDYCKKHYSWSAKLQVVSRPDAGASDTASTEAAMQEYLKTLTADWQSVVLLQATSPTTTREDINACLRQIEQGNDSALTVVRTHRFSWDDAGKPLNYDPANRPRRQDFDGLLIENGAVYATTAAAWQSSGVRISGEIGLVEMPADSYVEIDEEADWSTVEQILARRLKRLRKPSAIDTLILDVDGVFTTGQVSYGPQGEVSKTFDMRDGMGLEILREYGIKVIVLTSEDSDIVRSRMEKLKIEDLNLGVKDKYGWMLKRQEDGLLDPNSCAYVGDDVNDLACLCRVGWSLSPGDGMSQVLPYVDVVLNNPGGKGAIREACNFIKRYNLRYE